jgi:RNA polymerase sigma factor (TIGR02999 family)
MEPNRAAAILQLCYNRPFGLTLPAATSMTDVTRILAQIESGDPTAAEQLLPLVYDELRKLAAQKLAQEKRGQTLQATALVHDAYIRLVDVEKSQHWNSRGHFFAAAAEAMRRILVEAVRRKQSQKHGGGRERVMLADADLGVRDGNFDILALNDAIERLAADDPPAARLAELRIFAGLSVDEAAQALGVPHTSAYRQWTYAQAWLRAALDDNR